MILEDMPHEVMGATWSGDGKSIIFVANTGVRTELFVVDVATEKLEQITKGDHSSSWLRLRAEDRPDMS